MGQEFLNIIEKLKTAGDKFAISVFDNEKIKKVVIATYGNDLISQYGSIENFFEEINSKGHTDIAIQEYQKNGTGMKRIGDALRFNFSPKKQSNSAIVHEATPIPVHKQPAFLAGTGLGFAEIMQLNTNSVLKDRFEVENEFLKKRVKDLEGQVYDLKEEKLASKYDSDNKSNQADLFKEIIKAAPMLLGAFSKSNTGLNAPQVQNSNHQVSEVKADLIDLISSPNVSDAMAEVLFSIIEKIHTVQGFYENLDSLLNPKIEENEPTS